MATMKIRISKAAVDLEIDEEVVNAFSPEVFALVIKEGLTNLLNARMSKITTAKLEGNALAEARNAANSKALENLEMLKDGKPTKTQRGSATVSDKVSREVQTEAMKLAKAIVKDEIRAAGLRIAAVPASDITAYAKQILSEDDPNQPDSILAKAKANIENRKAIAKPKLSFDLKEDTKLAAKLDAEKAERKAATSAKQAGKVAPRQRGAKPGRESHANA